MVSGHHTLPPAHTPDNYNDTSCVLLTSSDQPHLVLAHEASLTVAVSAALGVSAGQLRLGAHAAAHLSDQGAVGILI